MPYMNLFNERVEVTCYSGESNKGIPYRAREFTFESAASTCDVSIHMYPKTTTIMVNRFVGPAETQGLFKFSTVIYKAHAPVLIESVLLAAGRGEGMVRLGDRVEQGLYTESKDTRWDDDVVKADMLRVSNNMMNKEDDHTDEDMWRAVYDFNEGDK